MHGYSDYDDSDADSDDTDDLDDLDDSNDLDAPTFTDAYAFDERGYGSDDTDGEDGPVLTRAGRLALLENESLPALERNDQLQTYRTLLEHAIASLAAEQHIANRGISIQIYLARYTDLAGGRMIGKRFEPSGGPVTNAELFAGYREAAEAIYEHIRLYPDPETDPWLDSQTAQADADNEGDSSASGLRAMTERLALIGQGRRFDELSQAQRDRVWALTAQAVGQAAPATERYLLADPPSAEMRPDLLAGYRPENDAGGVDDELLDDPLDEEESQQGYADGGDAAILARARRMAAREHSGRRLEDLTYADKTDILTRAASRFAGQRHTN